MKIINVIGIGIMIALVSFLGVVFGFLASGCAPKRFNMMGPVFLQTTDSAGGSGRSVRSPLYPLAYSPKDGGKDTTRGEGEKYLRQMTGCRGAQEDFKVVWRLVTDGRTTFHAKFLCGLNCHHTGGYCGRPHCIYLKRGQVKKKETPSRCTSTKKEAQRK